MSPSTGRSETAAYAIGIGAVAATTWLLVQLQGAVVRFGGDPHTRPYSIGYMIPIAIAALVGGRRPALASVAASLLATALILDRPDALTSLAGFGNWVGIFILAAGGVLLALGLDAVRQNVALLASSAASRAQMLAVMENAPVGVVLTDLEGRVAFANQEAVRVGALATASSGSAPALEAHVGNDIADVLAGGQKVVQRAFEIGGTEKRAWVESRSALVADESGKSVAALSILTDMSEHKQAEDELRAAIRREQTLNQLNQSLRGAVDERAIRSGAAQVLAIALGLDRCFFGRFEDADMVVEDEFHSGGCIALAGRYRLGAFGAQTGLPRTSLVIHGPESAEAGIFAEGLRASVGAAVVVPLDSESDRESAAFLVAAMADGQREWSAHDVDLAQAVAAQTRLAIETAGLQRRERRIAETLQRALLPPIPANIRGMDIERFYQPALSEAAIGGDFYDVFAAEKNCYALVIGDVSGKGLAAASQVSTVRNMLRFSLYESRTLAESFGRLNSILCQHSLLSGFVTLFAGTVDLGMKTLNFVSAGHEPVLVRRAQTGVVEELGATGPPIGVLASAVYSEHVVPMHEGDAMLCYTDGLTDAGIDRRLPLGIEGIREVMRSLRGAESSSEIVDTVLTAAHAAAPNGFADDICLLAAVVRASAATAYEPEDSSICW